MRSAVYGLASNRPIVERRQLKSPASPLVGNIDGDTIVNASVGGVFPANSPSIAVDPNDPSHVFASADDYRFGDAPRAGLYSALAGHGFTDTVEQYIDNGQEGYYTSGTSAVGIDRYGVDYLASVGVGTLGVPQSTTNALYVGLSLPVARGRYIERRLQPVDRPNVVNYFDDMPSLAVDNVAGSPFEGTVYCAFTQDQIVVNASQSVVFASYERNANQAATTASVQFSFPALMLSHLDPACSPSASEYCTSDAGTSIAVGPHGTVYVAYEHFDLATVTDQLLVAVSRDGGVSYQPPVRAATIDESTIFFGNPNNFPHIAVNQASGQVYIAWAETEPPAGLSQIEIVTSPNGKAGTWGVPKAVSTPLLGATRFSSALSVATTSGDVFVSYYDNGNDSNVSSFDYVYNRLVPGLGTNTGPIRLSQTPLLETDQFYQNSYQTRSSSAPTPTGARAAWVASLSGGADIETALMR